jgi:hypothetical protein
MADVMISPEVAAHTVTAEDGTVYEFTGGEYGIMDCLITEVLDDPTRETTASLDYVAEELRDLEYGRKVVGDLIQRGFIQEVAPGRITYTFAGSEAFLG